MIVLQISSQFLKDIIETIFLEKTISSLKVMIKSVIVIVIFAVVYVYQTIAVT